MTTLYLGICPAEIGFIVRERSNEIPARHACAGNAGIHDRAFVGTDARNRVSEIGGQDVHDARHQLETHGLLGQLFAQLFHTRGIPATLANGCNQLLVGLLQLPEVNARLFRIRSGIGGCIITIIIIVIADGIVIVFISAAGARFLGGGFLGTGDLLFNRIGIDDAGNQVIQSHLARFHAFIAAQQRRGRLRVHGQRLEDLGEAILDALGDHDFAFAGQQFNGTHFAHVHAHGIGGAAKLAVNGDQVGGGFLCRILVSRVLGAGEQQRIGVRRHFVHQDTHVVDHADDVFDLLRIDDFVGQVIIHFRVGQKALILALFDEQFQTGLLIFIHSNPRAPGCSNICVSTGAKKQSRSIVE